MILFSKIEAAYIVPTRGCVVVPIDFATPDLRVKAGDRIQIRNEGECIEAQITSVEWMVRSPGPGSFGLLLSKELDCSQITSNAEIWVERRE
jgi:hypothetical protein